MAAFAWLSAAAANGHPDAASRRDAVDAELTADQRREAKKLANKYSQYAAQPDLLHPAPAKP